MTGAPMTGAKLDVVVYDIEIARCIPDRNATREPDLEYCNGWGDYLGMGIGVLCAFDMRSRLPRVFLTDNLAGFAKLVDGRIALGYNNVGFDDRLCAAHGITLAGSYDLLVELRAAAGEPRGYTPGITRAGRKLADVAAINLGAEKTMSGALAPVAWQRGQRGEVIDYCLRDVMLLVGLVRRLPTLIDPVTRETVTLAMPGALVSA